MTPDFKTLVPAKITSEPKEVRRWWIETHESLKNKGFYNRKNVWPQVYNSDVVPNTIEVVEATAYQYAVDQWDYFVEETGKARTALTEAERTVAELTGRVSGLVSKLIEVENGLHGDCHVEIERLKSLLELRQEQVCVNDTLRSKLEIAITEMKRLHHSNFTSLLAATAWMGIPERKRDAFIEEHVSNSKFILDRALEQIKGGTDGKV